MSLKILDLRYVIPGRNAKKKRAAKGNRPFKAWFCSDSDHFSQ